MRARNEPEEEPLTTDVVILGGGLAGVACARTLGEEGVSVTLVDRNDYNQFQPLLYQVATSQLPAEDIARPLRTIVADLPTVDVRRRGRCVREALRSNPGPRRRANAVGRSPGGGRWSPTELLRGTRSRRSLINNLGNVLARSDPPDLAAARGLWERAAAAGDRAAAPMPRRAVCCD